jgi:hypothetical protein
MQASKRHFAYRHPTFGTKNAPKSISHWQGTVYYWWWAYLRKNSDYIECCELAGSGPISGLYKDYGDVRSDNFKDWWTSEGRGIRLFGEPVAEEFVRKLRPGDLVPSDDGLLTLVFPLDLPARHLQARFNLLLKQHHTGKKGIQAAKISRAKYRFEGQPNVPALKLSFQVYEYRLANPTKALWEIGNEMPGVIRTQKIKAGDDQYTKDQKKKALAATVSRYIRRAKESIDRVGRGLSP